MCQKLGNGPGVGKCPAPARVVQNLQTPRSGPVRGWGQVELTDA